MFEELNEFENFRRYRYLLIDNRVVLHWASPLSLEKLTYQFGENKAFGEKKLTTVLRTDLDYDPSVCPTLIQLAEPCILTDDVIIDDISRQAALECFWSQRYICAYLVSDQKPSALAKQLVNIGNSIGRILKEPYYPFFEPFRMQFLDEVGSNQSKAWLKAQFSQIYNYYYPSIHNGKFIQFTANNEPMPEKSWDIDDNLHIKNIRIVRTLVNAWANNRLQFEEQQSLPLSKDIIVEATQLVEQAMQLGLVDAGDILFWGICGLRHHQAFTQNPKVLMLTELAKKTPGTLSTQISNANIAIESTNIKEIR